MSNHAQKTGPWYFLEVLFQIFDDQPRLFHMGVPQGGGEGSLFLPSFKNEKVNVVIMIKYNNNEKVK